MTETLYINSPDLDVIGEVIDEALGEVTHAFDCATTDIDAPNAISPHLLARALPRFIAFLRRSDIESSGPGYNGAIRHNGEPSPGGRRAEIDRLSAEGNQGLRLLDSLIEWAQAMGLDALEHQLNTVMVLVALLIARRGGELNCPETVVNTLAAMANATSDSRELVELSDLMGELIFATSRLSISDWQNREQHRPWRVLILNRGITATRSHDTRIMETAFDDLIRNIPEDAERFFAQGMQQMEQLDYPDYVREVVSRYYRHSKSHVAH
ncbi:MAG: hypothetical protein PVH04_06420 [Gammaproteobacteria bacterium]|jgi:hypothetical protein